MSVDHLCVACHGGRRHSYGFSLGPRRPRTAFGLSRLTAGNGTGASPSATWQSSSYRLYQRRIAPAPTSAEIADAVNAATQSYGTGRSRTAIPRPTDAPKHAPTSAPNPCWDFDRCRDCRTSRGSWGRPILVSYESSGPQGSRRLEPQRRKLVRRLAEASPSARARAEQREHHRARARTVRVGPRRTSLRKTIFTSFSLYALNVFRIYFQPTLALATPKGRVGEERALPARRCLFGLRPKS